MSSTFFFYYQVEGKESKWNLDLADKRLEVISDRQPAFSTILDLTTLPSDNDWGKVRYRGPLYADFDAEGDLDLVCEQFKLFVLKLSDELDFDLDQARYYATGSKGFHIEIDQLCFMAKLPPTGTAWLPYVYRAMVESMVVDTLDTNVYTGKKGRQWRTPNVKRDNGCYKVQLSVEEVMGMTPEMYHDLISSPREALAVTPPSANAKFQMLFERSKDKVVVQMRGKKKRMAAASEVLDPWKRGNKTPPTIEGLMDGTLVAEGARFQELAMQLSIYAVSVEMSRDEFLDRCKGLTQTHEGDSRRYSGEAKMREELGRMWDYMSESSLYDFDVGPLRRLIKHTHTMSDLGVQDTEDKGDAKPVAAATATEGEETDEDAPQTDIHKGMRKGFFMNADGMWKRNADITEPICRATLRNVESFYDLDKGQFLGYEFDVAQTGSKTFRTMLAADAFTSSNSMKKFFVNHQIGFQGGDFEVMSLLDVMAEKAKRGGRINVYPREGFMVLKNPNTDSKDLVKVYLTQTSFISSLPEDHPDYFRLRYRPVHAVSSYNIDIHRAPDLDDRFRSAFHDLFSFTREDVAADLLGWFVACHYRSVYLELFNQFPMLQIYGEAGSGKSQTVWMLAHMHWYQNDISIKSAAGATPFVIDNHAASSTSAPYILDEFKPRELKLQRKGTYEKLKDMFKAAYMGVDIGERGTINKGAENNLGVIRSRATAPVVFMGEAIEMETAIIERSVTVNLTKTFQTKQRKSAFNRLHSDGTALSALGRAIMETGFKLNLEGVRNEVRAIQAEIETGMPDLEDETQKRAAPRMIFNRAIIIHGNRILKHVLQQAYGDEFDASVDALIATRTNGVTTAEAHVVAVHSMSEISKVVSRIASLSREQGSFHELLPNKDYLVDGDWVELRVERAYDQYRRYCASIHDTPLFDNVDAFSYALNSYAATIDKFCASSVLRTDNSNERIVRLSISRLMKEGAQSFRT